LRRLSAEPILRFAQDGLHDARRNDAREESVTILAERETLIKMRIAMIGCKGVPATMAFGGGVERHVEQLAPRLAAFGHEVTVYVRPFTNPRRHRTWNGCRLITIPTIRQKHVETITHVFLSSIHAIGQGYDIVHYHGVGPSTVAWIVRLFAPKTKVVVTFHSRDQFHEKWNVFGRMYLAWGEWTAVRFPHATIAVSHVIQKFCERMYGVHVAFIPNGIEPPRRRIASDAIEKMGLRPNGYFLGLGRLIPHKAFDVALDAFLTVPTALEFAIVGDAGYDERYAERLYAMAERDSRVKMLGFRTGRELEQLLAHCYALVHPSRSEGLSVAVLEAMSYGKVVVMSNIPENLELVDHSGISFPVDDVGRLRDTLAWLSEDAEILRERGDRAREMVIRDYNWDSIAVKTDRLYREVVSRKR
jgi:glycosyltransferase involved in cell wall biosynthesis